MIWAYVWFFTVFFEGDDNNNLLLIIAFFGRKFLENWLFSGNTLDKILQNKAKFAILNKNRPFKQTIIYFGLFL